MNYKTRNDFGKLFQEHLIEGSGAEIGVRFGLFSRMIAKHWKGRIVCVDLWEDREIFEVAQAVLESEQFHLHRGSSVQASTEYLKGFDWVYLDAGHSYGDLKADFEAWYPKVRTGGIISGHDYGVNDLPGVKQFIDEYMKLNPDIEMHFTTEDFWEGKEYQSWWFIKK